MAEPILWDRVALNTSASALLAPSRERGMLRSRGQGHEAQETPARPVRQRTKIWEFGTNLHCSIVGTCLSTAELRQVLTKIGCKDAAAATEHDVHASGVLLAGRHRDGAKLLHKALDRRHRAAINRFDRAKTDAEVRALWQEAVGSGDIPGAYWAALTHPATNDALVREVFAEVHMLSHLVGAANRVDIRRLRQLEVEKTALEAKIERQQRQLRDAVVTRDTTIRGLNRALEAQLMRDRDSAEHPVEPDAASWEILAGDLKRRLAASEHRRERAERLLDESRLAIAAEQRTREAAEQRELGLRQELEAIEAGFAFADTGSDRNAPPPLPRLEFTLLYLGGRQAGIGHLRMAAERCGAVFLHHDGGIEEREGLLPGLVNRADAVLFPVDCISHAAMSLVKRLCRQADKPFLPLRSTGLAPFCAALKNLALGVQNN